MNSCLKYFSACLLALLTQAALAQSSAPPLSTGLQSFAVLSGGVAGVTCTDSLVNGNVGRGFAAATPTRCTFTGGIPPATNAAAASALIDFASAYTALKGKPCSQGMLTTIPASVTLSPGVYCTGPTEALTATAVTLTLDAQNDPNAVWIFQIGAGLTGTNFTVTMANGGQACNVYWVPGAAATMTTSALKGNIVAGGDTGSITLTGGTLDGRALAKVAVTMTDSVVGCGGLAAALEGLSCKKHHRHHHKGHKGNQGHDDDDDDGDHHHDNDDNDYGHGKSPWGDKKGK
jgi:hypothetical protein